MSTIRHPIQSHTWSYAVAAAVVLASLLAVRMATVFSPSGSVGGSDSGTSVAAHPGKSYTAPCFPGRPDGSIELRHAGCPGGTP
jgi:hypothetical protein